VRYLWCWIFPPLGMLTGGRPGLAVVAFLMCCTLILWPVAAFWSYIIAAESYAENRNDKLIRALKGNRGRSRDRDDDEPARGGSDNPFDF
jgi:hypothetical protein